MAVMVPCAPTKRIWTCILGVSLAWFGAVFPVNAAAPLGANIDNRATGSFVNDVSGERADIASGTVTATVQAFLNLGLYRNNELNAFPGTQVVMPHRLINEGNAALTIDLHVTNLGGESLTAQQLNLWIDTNRNGLLDGADASLGQRSQVTLAALVLMDLFVVAVVPPEAAEGDTLRLALDAAAGDLAGRVADSVTVTRDTTPNLKNTTDNSEVKGATEFAVAVSFAASGTNDMKGTWIQWDDQQVQAVVIDVPLPSGLSVTREPTAPASFTPLYRVAGAAEGQYVTTLPEDRATIVSVAFAIEEAPPGVANTFQLYAQLEGESRTVAIESQVFYEDGRHRAAPVMVNFQSPTSPAAALSVNGESAQTEPLLARSGEDLQLSFRCNSCDVDTEQRDEIRAEVISTETGDAEILTLIEGAERSGEFSHEGLPLSQDGGMSVVTNDGELSVVANDVLTVTVYDNEGNAYTQSVLVDPAGFVFDSVSGAALTEIEVTLYRINGDGSLALAQVFADAAGQITSPNPYRTDEEGRYEFPFTAPGEYRVAITQAPASYRSPSIRSGSEMAEIADAYVDLTGFDDNDNLVKGRSITKAEGPSYAGSFTLANAAVFIDIPVDPTFVAEEDAAQGLALSLQPSADSGEVGDAITFTGQLNNLTASTLRDTELALQLPFGFALLPDSVQGDTGEISVSSEEGNGFRLGVADLPPESRVNFSFQVVITPAALNSRGVTSLQAEAQNLPVADLPAQRYVSPAAYAKVNITAGAFNDEGVIIGKVFYDCNENGTQDEEEDARGVAGVRLYLQNGRYVVTDDHGRFSFPRLSPATYVVKADTHTFPGEWRLTKSNINTVNDELMRVALHSGELARVNFPLHGCPRNSIEDNENLVSNDGVRSLDNKNQSVVPASPPLIKNNNTTSATAAMDNAIILQPSDNSIVYGGQTPLSVQVPVGTSVRVIVNGSRVKNSRVGEASKDYRNNLQHINYYAIPLAEGSNTLRVEARDPWGNIRKSQEITLHQPEALARMVWQESGDAFYADGNLYTLKLQLLDANNIPVDGDTPVSFALINGEGEIVATDLNALKPGVQTIARNGEVAVTVRAPTSSGTMTLEAESGSYHARSEIKFLPKLREWIVAGQVDSEWNARKTRGESDEQAAGFTLDDARIGGLEQAFDNDDPFAVRATVFAKGTIKDDYLVTLIADTDKRDSDDWSGRLDPDKDYPIYGDTSEQGAEGEAEKGLYLRVEHDESHFLIGDYRPSYDAKRTRAGAYHRKLYGAQHHYQNGDWQVETFAAQTKSNQIVDEFRARGIAGPFSLRQGNIVFGSESVEMITRTRAPDGNIVAVEVLRPFVDYDVDPVLGTILLRSPQTGSDERGRPRYIRVHYNVDEGHGLRRDISGADVNYKVSDSLLIGTRAVYENDAQSDYNLTSVNGQYNLVESTKVLAEWAHSSDDQLGSIARGDALALTMDHKTVKRDITLRMTDASDAFTNISSAIAPGTESAEIHWQERLNEKYHAWTTAISFRDSMSEMKTNSAEVGSRINISNNLKLGASLEKNISKHSMGGSQSDTSVGAQAYYKPEWLSALSIDARAYQSVSQSRQRQNLMLDYRLKQNGSLGLHWERFDGYNTNGDVDSQGVSHQRWSAGYKQQVHSTTELYTQYLLEESATGLVNSAATGMRFGYDVKKGLRLVAQAERTLDLEDNPDNPARYSWSVGLSSAANDERTWLTRVEMLADNDKRWLQELRWAQRLDAGWSLLAKEKIQWRNSVSNNVTDVLAGLAYRPTQKDHWDWLGSAAYHYAYANALSTAPKITRFTIKNTVNLRPAQKWVTTGSFVMQNTETSGAAAYSSLAWLARARVAYDFNSKWRGDVQGRYLDDRKFGGGKHGWGVELQRKLSRNFFIGVGYQRFTYENAAIDADSVFRRGWHLRFGGTFDESTLDGLLAALD